MTRRAVLVATAALLLAGCSRGTPVQDRELTVACGMCRFQMEGAHRCHWAAEIDGRQVPVTGPGVPLDHDSHGPEGMCVVERRAKVDGTLYSDKLMADRFELLPYEGPTADVEPHDHVH